jgi:hypothetical protein
MEYPLQLVRDLSTGAKYLRNREFLRNAYYMESKEFQVLDNTSLIFLQVPCPKCEIFIE